MRVQSPSPLDNPTTAPFPIYIRNDYAIDVSRGLITDVTTFNKFGRNTATVTGDAIWAASTAYTEPATGALCNVVSSSTDDAAAGIGARTITIVGIDKYYALVSETLTLNGTTIVSTVNTYRNIHRSYVLTAGSSETQVGTITITSTAAGTPVIGNLTIGYNQTQSTIYMVPRGYTGYLNDVNVNVQPSAPNQTIDIGLFIKDIGGVFRIQGDFLFREANVSFITKHYGTPIQFTEMSTVLFKCIVASASQDVTVDYSMILYKNR